MRNWIQVYGILWKQYLLRHRLWIVFLFILMIAIGVFERVMEGAGGEYQGIKAGIYWEDEKGGELLSKLQGEEGIFRFIGYTDEEEMIRQVENGTLECGYVLPESFYEDLLAGKAKRKITLYYSPASSAYKISSEIVYADLFEILSKDILRGYLREIGQSYVENGRIGAEEKLLSLNRQYADDGSTFHFFYQRIGERNVELPENINLFRGCVGVMIFFMSLLGLGNALEQEKTYKALPGPMGRRVKSGSIHVAVFGSIVAGGLCILVYNAFNHQVGNEREMFALLVYLIVLEVYVRILGLFIKNSRILYGLFPILILGSCLFGPVFIRIENYLPGVAWISKMFPVSIYLNLFY